MKKIHYLTKKTFVFFMLTLFLGQLTVTIANAQDNKPELPERKQTTLGLYVTSVEAYHKWSTDPDNVIILDIRTPEEFIFVGHAAMAWNIPAFFQTYNWDPEKKHFAMVPNADFVEHVKETFKSDEIILVTCRSGVRSAMVTNMLAKAGFKNVYNITDGFEGDKVKDTGSVFEGKRMVNGWKNSGLPYTYKIDPKLMLIPDTK